MTAECPWCGSRFALRHDGGKPQLFCRAGCRRALDAAGRRWIATALAAGVLALDDLKGGPAATRALCLNTASPQPPPRAGSEDSLSLLARLVVALPVGALADLPAELLDAIDGHAALVRMPNRR
jgi:hypothetical protein